MQLQLFLLISKCLLFHQQLVDGIVGRNRKGDIRQGSLEVILHIYTCMVCYFQTEVVFYFTQLGTRHDFNFKTHNLHLGRKVYHSFKAKEYNLSACTHCILSLSKNVFVNP